MDHRVVQLSEPPYYEQRDRLASNVVGYLKGGVSKPVLQRALEYWRNIDKETGDRITKDVNGG